MLRLDVRRLARQEVLVPGRSSRVHWGESAAIGVVAAEHYFRLQYTHNGRPVDYTILLSRTPCNYGGSRVWAICPAMGCTHRVAVLYLSGALFVCRHCTGQLYASQSESASWRDSRQSWKLRQQLGCAWGADDIPAAYIAKPKGMHWKTYARMVARLERVDLKAEAAFSAGLKRWRQALGWSSFRHSDTDDRLLACLQGSHAP